MLVRSSSVAVLAAAATAILVAPAGAGAAVAAADRIVLVSAGRTGGPANGDSTAGSEKGLSVSADGRFVAFTSYATDLVRGDSNGRRDVFVRDMRLGRTVRISVSSSGVQGDGESREASISGDGRYVAFASVASTLVPGDINDTWDVFVHDLRRGTTVRVSNGPGGAPGDGASFSPDISATGRHVAFQSYATTLVPGDTNDTSDIFVRDLVAGTVDRVSVRSDGSQHTAPSQRPSISADGSRVAFTSLGVVPSDPPPVLVDGSVYLRDRVRGTTVEVSAGLWDSRFFVNTSQDPVISDDGRFVAFSFIGWYGVGVDSVPNVYQYDVRRGRPQLVSADAQGLPLQAIEPVYRIDQSADGRYVAFGSFGQLVAGDLDAFSDVYRWDRRTGRLWQLTRGQSGDGLGSRGPAISADGRRVAFDADSNGLVPGPPAPAPQVYLWSVVG